MTDNNRRLKYCIIANFTLLCIISLLILFMRESNDTYFRIGPNDNLLIMSVKINTYDRYMLLQILLAFIEVIRVVVNEIASPILGFNIYNPDKKVITEFTKNELQIMANCMWFINSLIGVLSIIVTISQLDIAILRVVYAELTSIYTIRILLNEKEFRSEYNKVVNLDSEQNRKNKNDSYLYFF